MAQPVQPTMPMHELASLYDQLKYTGSKKVNKLLREFNAAKTDDQKEMIAEKLAKIIRLEARPLGSDGQLKLYEISKKGLQLPKFLRFIRAIFSGRTKEKTKLPDNLKTLQEALAKLTPDHFITRHGRFQHENYEKLSNLSLILNKLASHARENVKIGKIELKNECGLYDKVEVAIESLKENSKHINYPSQAQTLLADICKITKKDFTSLNDPGIKSALFNAVEKGEPGVEDVIKDLENLAASVKKLISITKEKTVIADLFEKISEPEPRKAPPKKEQWKEERAKWDKEERSLEAIKRSHPLQIRKDIYRQDTKVNSREIPSLGSSAVTATDEDETEKQRAIEKQLATVGETLTEALHKAIPKDKKYSDKDVQALRYAIEDMATQWTRNTASALHGKRADQLYEMEMGETTLSEHTRPVTITTTKDNKVIITYVTYRSVHEATKENPRGQTIGYDAQQTQIEIDLNKVEPKKLLESPKCGRVTNSWHGIRKSQSEISW